MTIIVIYPGCDRDEFSWGKQVGNLVYSGNVIFLGSVELALISEIEDDRIVFGGKTGEIEKIGVGSILVTGVSGKTPYGTLRKVTHITANGSQVTVSTLDATLPEAIKEGTIRIEKRLLEKDFRLKSKVDGILVTGPDKAFDGLAVTLDDFEIQNEGNSWATLEGAIGVSAEITITIEIRFNRIQEMNVTTVLHNIDEVTLRSSGLFYGSKDTTLAEFIHSPIITDSIVIVPEIAFNCGYEGTASGEIVSGVRQDRILTSQMRFQRYNWSENTFDHSEVFDFIEPYLTESTDVKISSGPEVMIRIFGVPVQSARAAGFYLVRSDETIPTGWRLFIGCDGYNIINAGLLGFRDDYIQKLDVDASEINNNGDK